MKIAVASSGKTLNDGVDSRFGRCPYFLIVDTKTGKFDVVENSASRSAHGAGIAAVQLVVDQGVQAVIVGNLGPKAREVLQKSKVRIFEGNDGVRIADALEKVKE